MTLLQELLNINEKVHTIGDKKPPRGAPENKARAFDTAKERDRSVLKKGTGKYYAADFMDEGDFITVGIYRDDIESPNYYGVSVVFTPDGKVELQGTDAISRKQAVQDKDKIIALARKAVNDPNTPTNYDGMHGRESLRGKGKMSFDIAEK